MTKRHSHLTSQPVFQWEGNLPYTIFLPGFMNNLCLSLCQTALSPPLYLSLNLLSPQLVHSLRLYSSSWSRTSDSSLINSRPHWIQNLTFPASKHRENLPCTGYPKCQRANLTSPVIVLDLIFLEIWGKISVNKIYSLYISEWYRYIC